MNELPKRILDSDTGEILPVLSGADAFDNQTDDVAYGLVVVPPHSKTNIVSQEKRKRTKRKLDYEWLIWNTSSAKEHVRLKLLTDNEKLFEHDVVPFINYRSVPCNDDDENYYMSLGDIERLLGWSRRRTSETIKGLEHKDILVRVPYGKGKYIMFNPVHFYRGQSEDRENLIDVYRSYRKLYCNNNSECQ